MADQTQDRNPELLLQNEFSDLTTDIIARTAFGSSFKEGKHIFDMQGKQMILTAKSFRSVYILGFRFLPTTKNRQRWNLEKEIKRSLRQVIDAREKSAAMKKLSSYGADLLGFMMSERKKQAGVNVKNNASLTTEEIIDECKTFYFSVHETTAVVVHNIVGHTGKSEVEKRYWKYVEKTSIQMQIA